MSLSAQTSHDQNSRLRMPRFLDLSHTIHDGLVTYPGLPEVRVGEHL